MPDLNCTEFEAQLEQLVEDHQMLEDWSEETAGPQAKAWRDLRAHANACAECRSLWNDFALLERVMVPWKESVPPVDLADAVLSRWKEENPPGNSAATSKTAAPARSASVKRSLWPMLLMIAVAVFACFPLWYSFPKDEKPPGVPVSITDAQESIENRRDLPETLSQAPSHPQEMEPEVDWETLAADARSAYWVLASDTADAFATVSVLVPPQKPALSPGPVSTDKPKKGWTEGIGSGLKPISQDIGRASGFLLDALPTL